ncbi:hypothetical protein D9M70_449800 [compost metagenome]
MAAVTAIHAQTRARPEKCRKPAIDIHQPLARAARGSLGFVAVVGIADAELEHAVAVVGLDAHQAALDARLHAMDQRVLEQRLEGQLGDRQVGRHAVHLPFQLQALAEPVLLDRQVAATQLQFLAPGHQAARLGQAGAEQVGEVEHRLLGLGRVDRHQAGDAVQAVEQEMRLDPCLQRLDARAQLGLLLAPPLALQIEVAQQQRRDDQPDQAVAQVQLQLAAARQRAAEVVIVGHRRADQRQHHHQQAAQKPGPGRAQAHQPRPQAAQHGGGEQHDPLHEQRGQRQAHPVEAGGHRLGEHQRQHQQLGQQHQHQQRLGGAQFGQEEIVGRRHHAAPVEQLEPIDTHRISIKRAGKWPHSCNESTELENRARIRAQPGNLAPDNAPRRPAGRACYHSASPPSAERIP